MAANYSQTQLDRALREQMRRECESLRLYEPLPYQDEFHSCRAQQVLIQKGNRTGGAHPLSEPVLTPAGWRPIGELRVGDQVIGGDGQPCNVIGVHPQGWKAVFRLTFDDGAESFCTECHLWRCKLKKTERFPSHPNYRAGKWEVYSLQQIREHGGDDPVARDRAVVPTHAVQWPDAALPIDPYILGVLIGDGCISQSSTTFTTADPEIAEEVGRRLPSGMRMRSAEPSSRGKAKAYFLIDGGNPIAAGLRVLGLRGRRSEDKFIPAQYLTSSVEQRLALLRGLMDTDGTAEKGGHCLFYTCSPQLARDVQALIRSLGGKSSVRWKETFITAKTKMRGRPVPKEMPDKSRCLNMAIVSVILPRKHRLFGLERKEARRAARERAVTDGRVLTSIRPEGNAECVCISVDSPDRTYFTRDYVITHNSQALMVEVARAVTGQDPYGKYPKRDGRCVLLGYGEKHIGRVFYDKLFRSGTFKVIRDKATGKWRTFRPWPQAEGGDLERIEEAKPAPPLIPQRFLAGKISWEKRSERVFSLVNLTTGWEIIATNSAGDPGQAQGISVNLYAIDEDLATSGWYEEAIGRIADCGGYIRWAALPHARNDDLMKLMELAESEAEKKHPVARIVRASIFDNKYIPRKSVEDSVAAWRSQGDDVYRKRAMGEISLDSVLMYPTFNRRIHDVMRGDGEKTEAQEILQLNAGEPPDDWTRYVSIDPGYNVCAIMFIAVPPPELGDQVFVYDECYIKEATDQHFGDAMLAKCGDKRFEAFIIDYHGGALRSIADGGVPIDKYAAALRERGVKAECGQGFRPGMDERKRREADMRNFLAITRSGKPRLMVVLPRCPNFCWEMERFKKKTVRHAGKDIPIDEGNRRVNTHAIEAVEQAIALDLQWVPKRKTAQKTMLDGFLDWANKAKRKQSLHDRLTRGGGGISLGPLGDRG